MTAADQAVLTRIDKLQALHEGFMKKPEAKLALWSLAADEYSLFRSFVDRETTLGAHTPELFLLFDHGFKTKGDYARVLTQELVGNVDIYNENHEPHDIRLDWKPASLAVPADSPHHFLLQLADFAASLEELDQGKVVAYLMPTEVTNWNRLADWILESFDRAWPDALRMYLVDFVEQPVLNKLRVSGYPQIMVLEPKLDVTEMMKEISQAAAGDKPGGVFQRHFIDLAKAASKQRMEEAEKHANLALAIALQEDWKHLQLSVFSTLGTAWMNKGDMDRAMAEFEKAELAARQAYELKEDSAAVNLANVLFYQGAVLTTTRKYREAAELYGSISPILHKGDPKSFSLLEAYRMTGQSYELAGAYPEAVEANWAALQMGESMQDEHRRHSTLPYVGAALIRLVEHGRGRYQNKDVDQQMTQWFGSDWIPKNALKT